MPLCRLHVSDSCSGLACVVMGTGWGFQGHRGEVAEAKTGIGLEGSRVLYAGHALAGWQKLSQGSLGGSRAVHTGSILAGWMKLRQAQIKDLKKLYTEVRVA